MSWDEGTATAHHRPHLPHPPHLTHPNHAPGETLASYFFVKEIVPVDTDSEENAEGDAGGAEEDGKGTAAAPAPVMGGMGSMSAPRAAQSAAPQAPPAPAPKMSNDAIMSLFGT